MKDWYLKMMVKAYHEGEPDEAMRYADMADIPPEDIVKVCEEQRELLEV